MQPWSCRLHAPDIVSICYSKTPDAVFLLAAALRLVAVAQRGDGSRLHLHPIVRLEGRVGQRIVRGMANRLHGGIRRTVRHITHSLRATLRDRSAQQSSGSRSTLRTVCTRLVRDSVRVCGLHCSTDIKKKKKKKKKNGREGTIARSKAVRSGGRGSGRSGGD